MSTVTTASPAAAFAERVRADFPLLSRPVNGRRLVYFDNGATTHKPRAVIDAVSRFYAEENANIHRGVHYLSQRATDAFEAARDRVQTFLNAAKREEVLFVRGTTEGINLVASGLTRLGTFQPGDEIVVTVMEHHANIVPWQIHAAPAGARLRPIPIDGHGQLDMDAFTAALGPKTRLVAAVHVSNSLGTINPVREMTRLAHERGIPVLLDGAQAVGHGPVDVRSIGADFYAFSGHKLFGPTGIGVLYIAEPWLDRLPPLLGGGDMIETVTFEHTTFQKAPNKFEAGTPDIAGAIGLHAGIDYLATLGWDTIGAVEDHLRHHAENRLGSIPGVHLIGTARHRVPVFSFVLDGAHPHDVGTILDDRGIAVRAGHHCTQPLMRHLGLPGTTRASIAFYNTTEEIDLLAEALPPIVDLFR